MKKLTIYTTILCTILLLFVQKNSAFGQDLNIAGNWNYNKSKSDLASYPAYTFPDKLFVVMTNDTVGIQAIFNKNLATTSPSKYPLNGTIVLKKYADGSERQTSFRVEDKKRSIVKHSKLLKANEIIRTTDEVWTISSDKQTLTILLTEKELGSNVYSIKGVFERRN